MSVTTRFPCYGGGRDCPVPKPQAVYVGAGPARVPCLHCQLHTHAIEAEPKVAAVQQWRAYCRSMEEEES
jgi:hypothetical protein